MSLHRTLQTFTATMLAVALLPGGLAAAVHQGGPPSPVALGLIGGGDPQLDGMVAPAGTTILSPADLQTGERAALVHLSNGGALVVAPGSRARLESAGGDRVRLSVLSGRLAFREPAAGATLALLQEQTALIGPAPALQIGEGARVAEEPVRMCRLDIDSPSAREIELCHQDPGECEWSLVDVPRSAVGNALAHGDVHAERNDLELDSSCKPKRGAGWLVPAGVAAAIVGSYLVVVDRRGDDEAPVSPNQR